MKQKLLSLLLVLILALTILSVGSAAAEVMLSPQQLEVNGVRTDCEKYNIDGSNYFKLRDIACLLRGTADAFSVDWDEANRTVRIHTGAVYRPIGQELLPGEDRSATAVLSPQRIVVNGVLQKDISVYNIGGNNFFRLRDLALALGFGVDYDKGTNTAIVTSPVPASAGGAFEVRFLDVGEGDSALVTCDGHSMLIDGGDSAQSRKLYSVLKAGETDYLDYLIATHLHTDHIGGLPGALNYAEAGTAFAPVSESDIPAFETLQKYLGAKGTEVTVPETGKTFCLGSACVKILRSVGYAEDLNDTSLVLKVTYGHRSFLFTGDAGSAEEEALLSSGFDLSADVLKVGHHGSNSSTGAEFLSTVHPEYAIISVGGGNDYGFPKSAVLNRLRSSGVELFRTDLHGTVRCSSDGESLRFETEKEADADIFSAPEDNSAEPAAYYIGNRNSLIFHRDHCVSLPKESNRVYFETREEALSAGYSPCHNCKP